MNWENLNLEEISRSLFLEGRNYILNLSRKPKRVAKDDMNTQTQVIIHLILHNIRRRSHTSIASLDIVYLLHYILVGRQVDIARVIANEIKMVVENGIQPRVKPNCPLVFPGFIMGLCRDTQIVLPS